MKQCIDYFDEINNEFRLSDEIEAFNSFELNEHFKDIVEYKSINYFARRY